MTLLLCAYVIMLPDQGSGGGEHIVAALSVRSSVRPSPEHNSYTIRAINLKLHRWIDLIKEKCSA